MPRPRVGGPSVGSAMPVPKGKLAYECSKCGAAPRQRCIKWADFGGARYHAGYLKKAHAERGKQGA